MQSFRGGFRLFNHNFKHLQSRVNGSISIGPDSIGSTGMVNQSSKCHHSTLFRGLGVEVGVRIEILDDSSCKRYSPSSTVLGLGFSRRSMSAVAQSALIDFSIPAVDAVPTRIKFKRVDKTSKHIMQILDREAVSEVQAQREIPEIRPGYAIQLKMEVPENKRRVQVVKGIVIARRNAGLNTTFRLRRLVGGVGVESLFPLYSPNIKEIKVLEKKKVRRAKLYYLRDKMNALRN